MKTNYIKAPLYNHEFIWIKKKPDVLSLPAARKQSDSSVLLITPSSTKDCGSNRPSVNNKPSFNAWKTSRMTPPKKVTNHPFIDDRKPSSKSVPIGDKTTHSRLCYTHNPSLRLKNWCLQNQYHNVLCHNTKKRKINRSGAKIFVRGDKKITPEKLIYPCPKRKAEDEFTGFNKGRKA